MAARRSPVTASGRGPGPGGESDAPVERFAGQRHQHHGDRPEHNGTTYYFTVDCGQLRRPGSGVGRGTGHSGGGAGGSGKLTALPGNGQVTLSWDPPVASGGLKITGYRLYAGTSPDFSGKAPLLPLTGTAATVTNLVNGTTYYFKVTTINGTGEGPGSETEAVPVTTPGRPPN